MSRKPYTNTTQADIYVGNVRIPAGGTRTVDSNLLPAEPTAEASPTADPLTALAGGKVTEVIAALPGLDEARLEQLAEIERGGKNRATLIEAIELAKLERVDQAAAAQSAAAQGTGAAE